MYGGVRTGDIDDEVDDTGERGGEGEGGIEDSESSEGMAGQGKYTILSRKLDMSRKTRPALGYEEILG